MKRSTAFILLVLMMASLSGCETVQRKFTRKPKQPKHVASSIYFDEGAYVKKYSNAYYYKTHFTLWRSWHDEVLNNLTGNGKKVARAAQESVGNLQQMQQYLKPQKSQELGVIINDMAEVVKKLDDTGRTSQAGPLRTELSRIRRAIDNNFYYDKVKGDLLADNVDLGNQESAPVDPDRPEVASAEDSQAPAKA